MLHELLVLRQLVRATRPVDDGAWVDEKGQLTAIGQSGFYRIVGELLFALISLLIWLKVFKGSRRRVQSGEEELEQYGEEEYEEEEEEEVKEEKHGWFPSFPSFFRKKKKEEPVQEEEEEVPLIPEEVARKFQGDLLPTTLFSCFKLPKKHSIIEGIFCSFCVFAENMEKSAPKNMRCGVLTRILIHFLFLIVFFPIVIFLALENRLELSRRPPGVKSANQCGRTCKAGQQIGGCGCFVELLKVVFCPWCTTMQAAEFLEVYEDAYGKDEDDAPYGKYEDAIEPEPQDRDRSASEGSNHASLNGEI